MKWEIGLSTGIAYRAPIGDVLPYMSDCGFRAVEVSTARGHVPFDDPRGLAAVRRSLSELRLRVHSLHAPFGHDLNLTGTDAALRRHTLEQLTVAADALQQLGGGLYVIHPGGEDQRWVWERQQRLDLSVKGLTSVWAECRRRDLTLIVETPLPHLLGGQMEDLSWIMERLPEDGVGMCLDTSHTALGGCLFEAIERFGRRLRHVQASDTRGHTDDHLVPGDGVIDWPRVLSALERVGYDGVFMLEVTGTGNVQEDVLRAATLLGNDGPLPHGWPARQGAGTC